MDRWETGPEEEKEARVWVESLPWPGFFLLPTVCSAPSQVLCPVLWHYPHYPGRAQLSQADRNATLSACLSATGLAVFWPGLDCLLAHLPVSSACPHVLSDSVSIGSPVTVKSHHGPCLLQEWAHLRSPYEHSVSPGVLCQFSWLSFPFSY